MMFGTTFEHSLMKSDIHKMCLSFIFHVSILACWAATPGARADQARKAGEWAASCFQD